MSKWSEEIIREHELQVQFDRGVAYQVQRQKMVNEAWQQEEEMWYEWAENNRFALADGTVLDGKINP